MAAVTSATALSVSPSYSSSSSLWNSRVVIIGGLAACAGLVLLYLARRYFSEKPPTGTQSSAKKPTGIQSKITPVVVKSEKPSAEAIIRIDANLLSRKPSKTLKYATNRWFDINQPLTWNPVSDKLEAYIDNLSLNEKTEAYVYQHEVNLSQHQPLKVTLNAKHSTGIYEIHDLIYQTDIGANEISPTLPSPQPLQKVDAPHPMPSKHTIDTPLAISISSNGTLNVQPLDPTIKNYTIENFSSKTHILFFKILGAFDNNYGKPQTEELDIAIVASPTTKSEDSDEEETSTATAEKKISVTPELLSRSWLSALHLKFAIKPPISGLEILSIQDTILL